MRQSPLRAGRGWRPSDFANDFARAARLLTNRNVPLALKLLLPGMALLYWVFPLDLIPGIPIDDMAIVLLAVRLFVTLGENSLVRARGTHGGSQTADGQDSQVVDTTWRVVDE